MGCRANGAASNSEVRNWLDRLPLMGDIAAVEALAAHAKRRMTGCVDVFDVGTQREQGVHQMATGRSRMRGTPSNTNSPLPRVSAAAKGRKAVPASPRERFALRAFVTNGPLTPSTTRSSPSLLIPMPNVLSASQHEPGVVAAQQVGEASAAFRHRGQQQRPVGNALRPRQAYIAGQRGHGLKCQWPHPWFRQRPCHSIAADIMGAPAPRWRQRHLAVPGGNQQVEKFRQGCRRRCATASCRDAQARPRPCRCAQSI